MTDSPQWHVTKHDAAYAIDEDANLCVERLRPYVPVTKSDFFKELGSLLKARRMTSDLVEVTVIEAQIVLCAMYYGRAKGI